MKRNKLLTERAVIDTLNELDISDGVGISSIACGVQRSAISAIRNLPPAEPLRETCWGCNCPKIKEAAEPRWIPVDEQAPNNEVLCCDKYGNIMLGFVYDSYVSETGFISASEESFMYDVTAWMPLPEPYKGGDA